MKIKLVFALVGIGFVLSAGASTIDELAQKQLDNEQLRLAAERAKLDKDKAGASAAFDTPRQFTASPYAPPSLVVQGVYGVGDKLMADVLVFGDASARSLSVNSTIGRWKVRSIRAEGIVMEMLSAGRRGKTHEYLIASTPLPDYRNDVPQSKMLPPIPPLMPLPGQMQQAIPPAVQILPLISNAASRD